MRLRGESEEIVGKALAGGRRDNVLLATKVHGTMGDDLFEPNSRRWIVREVENSLRRLGTDWIDLYQIHRPEQDTDIDETLGALTDLVQGKVRCIGSSTFPAIVEAQWVAERARERFVCEQPPYSILVRGSNDVPPTLLRHRMGDRVELAGGRLAVRQVAQGRRRPDLAALGDDPAAVRPPDPGQPAQARRGRRARPAGRRGGHHADRDGLAFVIRHPGITAAIIGPRTMSTSSRSSPPPTNWPDDVLDRIDEIVPPGNDVNPADAGWDNPASSPARCAADDAARRPRPVADRRGQRAGPGAAQLLDLAELTDRLGYHRYWVAEHHATPALGLCGAGDPDRRIAPRTRRDPRGQRRRDAAALQPAQGRRDVQPWSGLHLERIDLGLGRRPAPTR